ncbi:MAG: bifunctional adenosylcobinamide kinase/adenosylcobinamide-phosphate guanylyltransferase [Lachnospiraceae bacterium]|nr:bifunctional adenosylcobinamide kinase/adenosylcobinamide-phosphate guanylyltransferase [Lachnospiraceae bacterium]
MICMILGTPDSGKSKKAEDLTLKISGNDKKYYIATMIPFGKEGEERVKKHRNMRAGKGFETIECPVRVNEVIEKIDDSKNATCLLECMSNLVGNELHDPGRDKNNCSDEKISEYIVDSVMELAGAVKNLVIVSNSFPLEGEGYDDDTRRYVKVIDIVNNMLKQRVDEFYELT